MIPGFASAERAWENMNPFDSDCICGEDPLYTCDECGHLQDTTGTCPQPDCSEAGDLRQLSVDEIAETQPVAKCPQHGFCTGCASRNCEDCNG